MPWIQDADLDAAIARASSLMPVDVRDDFKLIVQAATAARNQCLSHTTAVREFLMAKGHDLCHVNRHTLAAAFSLQDVIPTRPSTLQEFAMGCFAYQQQVYGTSYEDTRLNEGLKRLGDLERGLTELALQVKRLNDSLEQQHGNKTERRV